MLYRMKIRTSLRVTPKRTYAILTIWTWRDKEDALSAMRLLDKAERNTGPGGFTQITFDEYEEPKPLVADEEEVRA